MSVILEHGNRFDLNSPLIAEYVQLCSSPTDEETLVEKHHMLPKSMFPEYVHYSWNIVNLTCKNHYRAHEILAQICLLQEDKKKMLCAWNFICHTRDTKEFVDADTYQKLKQAKSLAMSGENHVFFGKKRTKEVCEKISSNRKGIVFTEEHIRNLSTSHMGFRPTEETRRKLSSAKIGNKYNLGKKLSEEEKKRRKENGAWKSPTKEQRAKSSERMLEKNNPFYGKSHDADTIDKIKKSKLDKWVNGDRKTKHVLCNGVIYASRPIAASYLGVCTATITNWVKAGKARLIESSDVKNDKFIDYEVIRFHKDYPHA